MPPAPRDASAARPPAASARRHRFADIRDTRNRRATSWSLAPAALSRVQPAAIGVSHDPGIPHDGPAVSRTRNPNH